MLPWGVVAPTFLKPGPQEACAAAHIAGEQRPRPKASWAGSSPRLSKLFSVPVFSAPPPQVPEAKVPEWRSPEASFLWLCFLRIETAGKV